MSNLQRYDNNGLELMIDTNSGETFASIRATARMTDKDEKTIRNYVNGRVKGADKMTLKTAELNTPGGLQGADLLDENQMLEVISKYKPELLIKFAKAGLRVFLHQLAGFEVKSTAVEPQPLDLTEAIFGALSNQVKRVSYNDTQATNTIATIKPYQEKLNVAIN